MNFVLSKGKSKVTKTQGVIKLLKNLFQRYMQNISNKNLKNFQPQTESDKIQRYCLIDFDLLNIPFL